MIFPPFDEMPVFVQRTLADRCMKGLIIAKLTNRGNYNDLVTTFDKLIKLQDTPGILEQYETTKTFLETAKFKKRP